MEKDGELLGINSDYVYGGTEGTPLQNEGSDDYASIVANLNSAPVKTASSAEPRSLGLWQWQPPTVSDRVSAQHSQFLFTKIVDEPHGSLYLPTAKGEEVLVIDIRADLKAEILVFLEKVLDIRFLTLFPDLNGFSAGYGVGGGETDRW